MDTTPHRSAADRAPQHFPEFADRDAELKHLLKLWLTTGAPNRHIRRKREALLKRSLRRTGAPPLEYYRDEPDLVRALRGLRSGRPNAGKVDAEEPPR